MNKLFGRDNSRWKKDNSVLRARPLPAPLVSHHSGGSLSFSTSDSGNTGRSGIFRALFESDQRVRDLSEDDSNQYGPSDKIGKLHEGGGGRDQEGRDEDSPGELARMVGYLTATASEDWSLVLEVCDRASASESGAKEAVRALRREIKYGEPSSQLSAGRLWAIMLRNSSDVFIRQSSSRKFVDTIEDVIQSPRTSPVVRERLLDVVAAAAHATVSRHEKDGFRGLWRRIKPADKPDDGIPFESSDPMFNPPIHRSSQTVEPPHKILPSLPPEKPIAITSYTAQPLLSNRVPITLEEDIRRLFQECRIGRGNAALLSEALMFAKPEDLEEKEIIKEFHMKCEASRELIYAQIPWATANAERSRIHNATSTENNRTNGPQAPSNVDAHVDKPSEETTEILLLTALLEAHQELSETLAIYNDIERILLEAEDQNETNEIKSHRNKSSANTNFTQHRKLSLPPLEIGPTSRSTSPSLTASPILPAPPTPTKVNPPAEPPVKLGHPEPYLRSLLPPSPLHDPRLPSSLRSGIASPERPVALIDNHNEMSSAAETHYGTLQFRSKKDSRDEAIQVDLTRLIGFLTATASEDWGLVLEVCEGASASESNAKEAVRALRREFRYGEPPSQLAGARLWAIMLRNSSQVFIRQSTSRKFLDTIEDVIVARRTAPVVRDRLLDVVAGAAHASISRNEGDGFRELWRRVRPLDKPEDGIPFDASDSMFNPPITQTPPAAESHREELQLPRPSGHIATTSLVTSQQLLGSNDMFTLEEDIRRLFQECKIGRGNAALLSEALAFARPEDLIERDVIKELYEKCRDSQDHIFAQIPWAVAGAERARVRKAEEAHTEEPLEETTEVLLLTALRGANEDLLEALKVYDDLEEVLLKEQDAKDRSVETLARHLTETEPESVSMASIWHQLERPGADSVAILRSVIHSAKYAEFSIGLQGKEAHDFIEILDYAIASTHKNTDLFHEFRRLCGRTGLLPSSHMLLGRLVKSGDQPKASGGFGDVWKGIYQGHGVAIKALRVYSTNDMEKIKKTFCQEVVTWKRLSHPNVVRFLGVSTTLFPLAMVSEWMEQGNVRQYVRSNPETTRLKLLIDIGEGLNYLHSFHVVHGDLKGDNILVNEEGWCCLCDFGLTSITTTMRATITAPNARGSIRWMAPELFDMEDDGTEKTRPSETSDIFALSMVFMEVFTGKLPFHTYRHDEQVIFKVISGARPKRPGHALDLGLSDSLWELMEMCWDADRDKRPSASFILDRLRHLDPGISLPPLIQDFDHNSKESIRAVRSVLSSREDVLVELHDSDTHKFIDILDKTMDSRHADEEISRKCLRTLKRICGRTGFLPSSCKIPEGQLVKTTDLAVGSRRYADTWEGVYDNHRVRVKSLRTNSVVDHVRVRMRFYSEAAVWKRLNHPNVVPFLGVSTTPDLLCTVSPWVVNGNIIEYLSSNPTTDRLHLLVDVAKGLEYLHSYNVVHGNLKGADILINGGGVACISDFGLATIANETLNGSNDTSAYLSIRWMAPELLDPENTGRGSNGSSKASDVYSFAMVIIEVFTGNVPFHGYRQEGVVVRVVEGKRPERPERAVDIGLSNAVWDLVEMCWHQQREDRPTISHVIYLLCDAANISPPTSTSWF